MNVMEIVMLIFDFLRMVVLFNYELTVAIYRLFVPVELKNLNGEIVLVS